MNKASMTEKINLLHTAMGKKKADIILRGGKVVDVYTQQIYSADVAICNERIAYVGNAAHTIGPDTKIVDVSHKWLAPGFIDGHLHIGGTHLSMTEFGKVSLLHGGTALATGFFEIAIIQSLEGIRKFLNELKATGVKPLFVIPMSAFHQNEKFENTMTFTEKEALEALEWEECYGVNEVNLSRIAEENQQVLKIVDRAQQLGKILVGHAAGIHGKELQGAMAFCGYISDHEADSAYDAEEKARLGITIALRDGSVGENLQDILEQINGEYEKLGDFGFSTDESDPSRMVYQGYLDLKVKIAIKKGIKPAMAIRAASLNMARFFRIDDEIGSITPGKRADILVIDDLKEVHITDVLTDGKFAVRNGEYCRDINAPQYDKKIMNSICLQQITEETIQIKVDTDKSVKVNVIGMNGNPLITDPLQYMMKPENGFIHQDTDRDIAKIVTMDRHNISGKIGIGFIHGFGFRKGAIGSSCNPCSENINLIGTNDKDMVVAANFLIQNQGGYVVVCEGKIIAALRLPIGGICSELPYEEVARGMREVESAAATLGCCFQSIFYKLAFMVYPTQFPSYKLSTHGLVNVSVEKEELIDLICY